VCVTAEECVKFDKYDISYTCALCELNGSPWITDNHSVLLDKSQAVLQENINVPLSKSTEKKVYINRSSASGSLPNQKGNGAHSEAKVTVV